MTDDTKQLIQLQLSMLKQTMKNEGVIFALAVDKQDFDKSSLSFMDKQSFINGNNKDGFSVSLTELNRELL